ncbi:HAD-IA family hydrolase [Tessaracoccus coleopterorum]|uniref:HAD-IA family hydrolase n=1 Tax=Tessaracoccus coleopterorum TaxID=2714950 RepID=UPI0022B233DC|nr:HAD-IA family hydrolase [Tessaracoccus coleopterorum]
MGRGHLGQPWADAQAARRGRSSYPEVMVAAEDVRVGKPDPQGYLLAAARLGFAPERCLVVEDAPAGIGAGLAAGSPVLGVATSHPAVDIASAHAVVGTSAVCV